MVSKYVKEQQKILADAWDKDTPLTAKQQRKFEDKMASSAGVELIPVKKSKEIEDG